MSTFHFKQFSVTQTQSAMKIGTDSVLLGCVCDSKDATAILDIGSGTGLLALMLAQKSNARIDAVEIDELAAQEARQNFAASPWGSRLTIYHTSLQDFKMSNLYDLIISNPPYFRHKQQFKVADMQRSRARHDQDLPLETLALKVEQLLTVDGKFWCILPSVESNDFIKICASINLNLAHCIRIIPKTGKAHNRLIMCFIKTPLQNLTSADIVIYDKDSLPTNQYKAITRDYYLWKGDDSSVELKW
jgi:tRNA1Val (adenine37-N6)-methyltransferase